MGVPSGASPGNLGKARLAVAGNTAMANDRLGKARNANLPDSPLEWCPKQGRRMQGRMYGGVGGPEARCRALACRKHGTAVRIQTDNNYYQADNNCYQVDNSYYPTDNSFKSKGRGWESTGQGMRMCGAGDARPGTAKPLPGIPARERGFVFFLWGGGYPPGRAWHPIHTGIVTALASSFGTTPTAGRRSPAR